MRECYNQQNAQRLTKTRSEPLRIDPHAHSSLLRFLAPPAAPEPIPSDAALPAA